MPIGKHFNGHGEEVMKSMARTYKNKKTAERVFYATEKNRKGLQHHTTEMVRKGHLRVK